MSKKMSFTAVVVAEDEGEFGPTHRSIEVAMQKAGIDFAMPANAGDPIVINVKVKTI